MTVESIAYLRKRNESNSTDQQGKLLGLQILRFGAAFAVVLFHIGSGYQIDFGNNINLFSIGAAGVDIFFVLSGFIIALTTDPERGAWYFCRRRIVRVVPLYWVLTLGIALIGVLLPDLLNSTNVNLEFFLKSLFFIPYERSDGAIQPLLFLGWTLNYEMFFYSIYAVCLLLGWKSPLLPVSVVIALVITGRVFDSSNVIFRFYSNPIMLEFALGIIIYLLYNKNPGWFNGKTLLFSLVAMIIYVSSLFLPNIPWLLASAAPATLLVISFIGFKPQNSLFISLLVFLGNASYSLYLSHPYVIQMFSKISPPNSSLGVQFVIGTISAAICLLLSALLYKGVELRFQHYTNSILTRYLNKGREILK